MKIWRFLSNNLLNICLVLVSAAFFVFIGAGTCAGETSTTVPTRSEARRPESPRPTTPSRPIPMMDSAKKFMTDLMNKDDYPFGFDKPLLDFDPNDRKDATLRFYLGVKKAAESDLATLVLITPEVQGISTDREALRKFLFRSSEDPSRSLARLAQKHLKDAKFEKSSKYVVNQGRSYEQYVYSKLAPFIELPIYSPAEKLGTLGIELADEADKQKMGLWQAELNNHKKALTSAFSTIEKLASQVLEDDLDVKGERPGGHHLPLFGATAEALISELERLDSKATVSNPQSIIALSKAILSDPDFESEYLESATPEKFVVAKNIFDKLVDRFDEMRLFCAKKVIKTSRLAQKVGIPQERRNRLLALGYIYEHFCEVPIAKLKFEADLDNGKKILQEELLARSVKVPGPRDIFAERAIQVYNRLLGIPVPVSREEEGFVNPKPDGEKALPEGPPPAPPPPAPPPPVSVMTPPKEQREEKEEAVKSLQWPTDELAKNTGFLNSKKVLYGYDARVFKTEEALSAQRRELSFYVGILGGGPKKKDEPLKLYLIGPKLVSADKAPLKVKKNYRLFFDDRMKLTYPVDNIEGVQKEAFPKIIEHKGKPASVTQITLLPQPELLELFDEATYEAWKKPADLQQRRLYKLKIKVGEHPSDSNFDVFLGNILNFGNLDVRAPTLDQSLNDFEKVLSSQITDRDTLTPGEEKEWPEKNLFHALFELETNENIEALLSGNAAEEALSTVKIVNDRLDRLYKTCESLRDARTKASKGKIEFPISNANTMRAFYSRECKNASVTAFAISKNNAEACMADVVDRACLIPVKSLLDTVQHIEKKIADQKPALLEKDKYTEAMKAVFEKLVKKVRPEETVEETLKKGLEKRFQPRPPEEEEEDQPEEEWEFN